MMNGADLTTVVPVEEMRGENEQETSGLARMFDEARGFLAAFDWCLTIEESYFGFGYASIVAVFLFRIRPARPSVDDWLWVVVGDLPPAYLVTEGNPTPDLAVDGYISEMTKWVKAAKKGRSVEDLIPVNVPPTRENAAALERRLGVLRQLIEGTVERGKSKRVSREVH